MHQVRSHGSHRPGLGGHHQFPIGADQSLAAIEEDLIGASQPRKGDRDGHCQGAAGQQQGDKPLSPETAIQLGIFFQQSGTADLHTQNARQRRGRGIRQGNVHPQDGRFSIGLDPEFRKHFPRDQAFQLGGIRLRNRLLAINSRGQSAAGVEDRDALDMGQLRQRGHFDGGQERIIHSLGAQGGKASLEQGRHTTGFAFGQTRTEFPAQREARTENCQHQHSQGYRHRREGGPMHSIRESVRFQNSHSNPPVAVWEEYV